MQYCEHSVNFVQVDTSLKQIYDFNISIKVIYLTLLCDERCETEFFQNNGHEAEL